MTGAMAALLFAAGAATVCVALFARAKKPSNGVRSRAANDSSFDGGWSFASTDVSSGAADSSACSSSGSDGGGDCGGGGDSGGGSGD
jgi:hypothetical protein